jgi:hypothetical protein
MQHQVHLVKLPEGVQFPAHLRERIAYDSQRQELSFRGFMTKYAYDELSQLAKDVSYHEALEKLFVLSSEEVQERPRTKLPLAVVAGAAACVLALGLLIWATMFRHPAAPAAPGVVQAAGR